jgi:OOP family OmpA-OmpF porin
MGMLRDRINVSTCALIGWRMHRATAIALVFVGLMLCGVDARAQDCADDPSAQEHPAVQRYDGACLLRSQRKTFDSYWLVLGKPVKRGTVWTTDPGQNLEGAVTRLMYAAPAGRSALEVFRNYEQGLAEQGYEILYRCAKAECGGRPLLMEVLFGNGQRRAFADSGASTGSDRAYYSFPDPNDAYFLVARSADGATHVTVYVGFKSSTVVKETSDRPIVLADVIESAAMEQNLVDASAMNKAISETGRIALRNIYFDFGSDALTAESTPALEQIAALLKQQSGLSLYVVGHTDSVGTHEANMSLSRRRAESVVQALIRQHGVAASRLVPAGVGDLAPVASNRSDAGRAENRRVELVERPR